MSPTDAAVPAAHAAFNKVPSQARSRLRPHPAGSGGPLETKVAHQMLSRSYAGGMPRESHYESDYSAFDFFSTPDLPAWRTPQIGAIGAAIARWSIDPEERLLLSMPTGSGKSGVAAALPYIARAHRVLVIVPSKELRDQMAEAFHEEDVLRSIGAVSGSGHPVVEKVEGRSIDWSLLESADVVVALPNSISPAHFEPGAEPDPDFFDLLIIDEAHHTPAATWRLILDYYPRARAVLLTATPRRSDGKSLPGSHAFHYPLRLAMAEGIYQTIQPRVLDILDDSTLEGRDEQIAAEVARTASEPAHANSAILIRSASVARAGRLKTLYGGLGLSAEILTAKVPTDTRKNVIRRWREGELRAVIAVDMLAEGFDLPSLRIVGYHDKHKSEVATMQFIGRLARSSAAHPQPSVLVTARDQDIYPSIQGALHELYKEDADWADLLPGLIDEPVRNRQLDVEYLNSFPDTPPNINLGALAPLARAIIYEIPLASDFEPAFAGGEIPDELQAGAMIASQTVTYVGLNSQATQLVVLTSRLETPRWYINDAGLTRPVFDLHVLSWHRSADLTKPHLLFVNSQDKRIASAIRLVIDPSGILRNGDPASLQDAFDSLERISVSSIGVRNTFAGTPGTPAYAMFAGSGVDRGLREADTSSRALGHAMAQVEPAEGGSTNAGMAAAKSKYWETRYLPLRAYEAFSAELAGRYWFPRTARSGPLLPNVARAIRTDTFPTSEAIHVELNPSLLGRGWALADGRAIENLDLQFDHVRPPTTSEIYFEVIDPRNPSPVVWAGYQDVQGKFTTTSESSKVTRGAGLHASLGELMALSPPTIYFLDGHSIYGGVTYLPVTTENWLPEATEYTPWDWSGTLTTRETARAGQTNSIHDRVEAELVATVAPSGTSRWVMRNDGSGELADHVVIEMPPSRRPRLELWHSKGAQNINPGVRVTDMQVVTQQAAKSRRHVTDRSLWNRIGRRLLGEESPTLILLSGNRDDLLALCGRDPTREADSIAQRPPAVNGRIVVVQPGLSLQLLEDALRANDLSAGQVREFLTFLANSIQGLAAVQVVVSR